MSEEVKLHVHDNREGCLQITFGIAPKDERQRYRWLQRGLHDWLGTNANFLLEVRPIRYRGKLYGLIAFYDPAPPSLSLEVDPALLSKHGAEYVEAVMSEVAQFIASTNDAHPILALTNRREITVVVNRSLQKGKVVPLATFRQHLTDPARSELDAWLADNSPGFFVCRLNDFPNV